MTISHPLSAFMDLVAQAPDAPLLAQGDTVQSRADIVRQAGNLAAGLAARSIVPQPDGVQPQRVLMVLPNSALMVALLPAIWSQGALPMFLSSKASAAQREGVIAFYRPDLVVDEAILNDLAQAEGEIGPARPGPQDDASVVFTSGSTGLPKGVVQKGATLTDSAWRVARTLGYGSCERILVPIPFAHDYGWGQMLSGLACGHFLILPERDILADIAVAINLHKPTVFAGVPSLYSALLFGISGFEKAETDSLRLLTSTGSSFSPRLASALAERIPAAHLFRNYGLTETYRGCCLRPQDQAAQPGSVGHPIEGVDIRIITADGREAEPDEEGEIVHLGGGVFDRYLDDPDETARTKRIIDGRQAVFTGDIGTLDQAGFLTLLGRRDRLVKSQDIRVNLGDVEEALGGLEGVDEVAVLPRIHDLHGTELVAFYVSKDGAGPRDIQRQANRFLPAHLRPRVVSCLDEMPRTPVGKIDYPALKLRMSE